MDLQVALEQRHSVRAFKPDPVPRDKLDKLFWAASRAPSSLNEQPWRFYVATGESRDSVLEVMAQSTHYLEEYMRVIGHEVTESVIRWYSELGGAPVIVACTMPKVDDEFARLNKHLSMGAAVQSLMLEATELGLGTCSVTFAYWVNGEISKVLGVPDDRIVVSMVAIGYPAMDPQAPPKRDDVAVYVD